MGTKVQSLPGYCSMRDLNEESSSCGWPLYYGDKTVANGQYYHNYLSSDAADACSAHDKDFVKQTMLEHEAIFKNQVFELHRLYRIQRDLMDEVKMKDLHRNQISVETSFSAGPLASQITSEDGKKWHIPGFPIAGSSTCARPSISGVGGIHSPLSSNKENGKQACLFPSPNGSNSKDVDVEILGFRPSKVRRKMFDLHLPADEYIDTEENEKSGDEKFLSDRNCKPDKGGAVKLLCGNAGKSGSQDDISRPEQSLRSWSGLADLNEPVQVEETNDVAYVSPLNHSPYQAANECSDLSAKHHDSRFFGLSREDLLNSHHGTDTWARNNGSLENGSNRKVWISSMESGQAKSKLKSLPLVLKQEPLLLSSQTMQDAFSKAHEPTSDYLTNRSQADLPREKIANSLDISERNHEYTANKHPESVVLSHRHGPFANATSSDLARCWSHSSWEMASSLNQKLIPGQTPPSGALSRSSPSNQSNGILGDSWPLNSNSKLNTRYQCQSSGKNGFYTGTSRGSKELSVNFSSISYLNYDNNCIKLPEHFNNSSANCYNGSNLNLNCNDVKSAKDINLNEILSNGSSNDLVSQSGLGIMDGEQKHGRQLAVLPWLRAKTICRNEAPNAGRSLNAGGLNVFQVVSLSSKDETGKGSNGKFMHSATPGLCSNDIELRRTEVCESSSKRKILGVPIFDIPHISAKEPSSFSSPSVSVPNPSDVEFVKNNRKKQILDINLPCDAAAPDLDEQAANEVIVSETGSSAMKANSRNHIDLNMIMNEDEALITIPATNLEKKTEIDLEAPAVPETEEDAIPEQKKLETPLVSPLGSQHTVEKVQDELMRYAAEAIVVLSSSCCQQVDDVISGPSESPVADPLSWFVDIVSSCVDDLEMKTDNSREKDGEDNEESPSEGMDYFESMTLKLEETKEEDYMPQPLVPENFKLEETGTTTLPTRTRKGPARRGRQRRDFQRDILPGLTSLSRHEVTEDLQTFGGLMRATGHAWHSGLNRRSSSRNGCGRGRRRLQPQVTPSPPPLPPPPPVVATIETSTPLIQQLNNIEVGLEDRSLTGWGKTTRRPRRQRCPAGNPPSIRLI